MALKPCRECGAQVSTEAEVCPHCGVRSPTAKSGRNPRGCLPAALVVLAVVFVVGILATGKPTGTDTDNSSTEKKLTIEEYVNKHVQCDKPYDMMSKHGRSEAEICNRAKDYHTTPGFVVTMELAFYKSGATGVSAYTHELIDSQPSIREYLRSRD